MVHKVNIYDVAAGFDAGGWMRPVRIHETEDPEEMVFLSRVSEHLTLKPEKRDQIFSVAHEIMSKYSGAEL